MPKYDPSYIRSAVISPDGAFSFQRLTTAVRGLVTQYDNRPDRDAVLVFVQNGDANVENWTEGCANWIATQKEFLAMLGIRQIKFLPPGAHAEDVQTVLSEINERRVLVITNDPQFTGYVPEGFALDGYQPVAPDTNFYVSFLMPKGV